MQHLTPETASAGLPRSSSYNSLQRRLMRNKATSIELGLQKPDEGTNNEDVRFFLFFYIIVSTSDYSLSFYSIVF